ncbi:MAG: hypothetical protein AAGH15_15420, partial [Myxococcota bacterium]
MARFLFLQNTVALARSIAEPPPGTAIRVIDQYAFRPEDLADVAGVLFCQHLDERHLGERRAVWDAFLSRGGALAVNGPFARPFLSALAPYRPSGDGSAAGWMLELAEAHPITAGVAAKDLSYRRGVVGFWARGGSTPPNGARVLTRFVATGGVADWAWVAPGGGRLFV